MGPYIDPRQLEIVLVVAEELNTRKAAERLKVHQSTVSKGIRQFEKEQELTVFVREGKRIADLTPEGGRFLEHIKPAFQAVSVGGCPGQRDSGDDPPQERRHIHVRVFASGLRGDAERSTVRPKCTVSGTPPSASPTEALRDICFVRSGVLQAGLTYAFPQRHDLVQIPVGEEPMCAVYPRKPGTRARAGIDLEDLRSQPLYVLSSDHQQPELRECLVSECTRRGFTPKIVEETDSARQAFDLLLDRGGVAIMPECMYVGAPADLDCSRIAGLEETPLVLTYRRATDMRTEKIIREIARSLRDGRREDRLKEKF